MDILERLREAAKIPVETDCVGDIGVLEAARVEIERLRAELATHNDILAIAKEMRGPEYERGYRAGINDAAHEIDCGGQPDCTATKLDDGSCIYSCSKDCQHDEAEYIRSLKPPGAREPNTFRKLLDGSTEATE